MNPRTSTPTSVSSSRPARPNAIVAESAHARLQWLTLDDALDLVAEDNLRTTLARIGELFVAV